MRRCRRKEAAPRRGTVRGKNGRTAGTTSDFQLPWCCAHYASQLITGRSCLSRTRACLLLESRSKGFAVWRGARQGRPTWDRPEHERGHYLSMYKLSAWWGSFRQYLCALCVMHGDLWGVKAYIGIMGRAANNCILSQQIVSIFTDHTSIAQQLSRSQRIWTWGGAPSSNPLSSAMRT